MSTLIEVTSKYSVIIELKKSISILVDGVPGSSFKIGDTCEEDSYNLSYHGTIENITEKTVVVKPKYSEKRRRMKLEEFCWRNHNFQLGESANRNAEVSMTI